jgi:two-component system, chemotaxis family, response regulator Rcp1
VRNILIVEDNQGDFVLMKEAFQQSGIKCTLWPVANGVDALRFLQKAFPYQSAPRPDLILLDLDVPEKDGRQIMKEICEDNSLKDIPVVVLSGSHMPEDVQLAYAHPRGSFIRKPMDYGQFIQAVKAIHAYWASVTLPSS